VNTQRTDFLVGLFILISVGIMAGTLIVTSGLGEVRNDLFLRVASAEALTQDTKVVLQGLSVGRIRQVNPLVDSTSGGISFLARLSIQDQFPNGTKLRLPVGTRALISQPTPIAPAVIELVFPESTPLGQYLEPGDTVDSERGRDILAAVGDLAEAVSSEIDGALAETRALMARTNDAVRQTQQLMAANGPRVEEVLTRLAGTLDDTRMLLADIQPRIGPLHDSITVTLVDTRQLLHRMDTLVTTASEMADENRDVFRETAELLLRSAVVLEHFADQVSRRPTRLLTGVRPPPPDTSKEQH
jgi:ABC-type transporter Mla subunit MlaD